MRKMKKTNKPSVAFVYLPTVQYDEIFDLYNDPPHLAMPGGIMYLSSSLKKNSNVSDIFLLDYSIASKKLHNDFRTGETYVKEYKNNPKKFKISSLHNKKDESTYRITVDEKQDFQVVKSIIENFNKKKLNFY